MALTTPAASGGVVSSTPAPAANSAQNPTSLYQALPGLQGMLGSAQTNISNLLTGLPSASLARTGNAYFGAGAGQPGAGGAGTFIGNRGADLYGQQAQQNQQSGLSNLMGLIQGTSGTLAPTPGQNQQNSQFYSQLGQQGGEFQQSFAEQQFNDQINALIGLSNSGLGGIPGSPGGGGGGAPFSLPSLSYASPYS